jgi:hypothetical protein
MKYLILIISLYLTISNAMLVCEVSRLHNYNIPKAFISNHLEHVYGGSFVKEHIGEINFCESINHNEYNVRYLLRHKIDLYIKFFESSDTLDKNFYYELHYNIGLVFSSSRYRSARDIERETGCKMKSYTSDSNYECQKLYAKKWAGNIVKN